MATSTPRSSDVDLVWFDAEAKLELVECEPIQKLQLNELIEEELELSALV